MLLSAAQLSLTESLLTLLLYISTLCIFYNLLDKLLNVKQASDLPAVQKSRHRIDPDAIPSPVSLLCDYRFLSASSCPHGMLALTQFSLLFLSI